MVEMYPIPSTRVRATREVLERGMARPASVVAAAKTARTHVTTSSAERPCSCSCLDF